ncbi:CLUMA_CG013737, isoform A [Clunio marinus]|uniref:CLUMA_CG013737, isoform A n=1 Tax=Clunio marinus TaxID=568069 RepID=A0A1J1IJR6_9DIPT|nr:CLUMA_CG013737, isoform A [Clunio marinus]
MSQESEKSLNISEANDMTKFFIDTPSNDQVRNYFLQQIRLARHLTPETESSPELSISFEEYINKQRSKRSEEDKTDSMENLRVSSKSSATSLAGRINRFASLNDTTVNGLEDTLMKCDDESFLAMERMCENTLNLNNVSEHLIDLTTLDDSPVDLHVKSNRKADETDLRNIEAPSFLFNNSSIISPPSMNSPLAAAKANRPSTILEVSESSCSWKTNTTYRTALIQTGSTEASDYKTADEGTFTKSEIQEEDEEILIKMPKIRSFYDNSITKDSLDVTNDDQKSRDMTKDSLNEISSSGVDSSFDREEDESLDLAGAENMNDTLEQIEFMLAQAQKMQEKKDTEKKAIPIAISPFTAKTPQHSSVTKTLKPGTAVKTISSPLIKFSPVVKNSPAQANAGFKHPSQKSATKTPLSHLTASHKKKYQDVPSPVSRYINNTPGLPLTSTARVYPGIGTSPKRFNFRDSDKFSKENENTKSASKLTSSLPMRAKTNSSTMAKVLVHRDLEKVPGGQKIHNLLKHSSPTVTYHQGHVRTTDQPKIFQNRMHNETAISEQSFADLSLISGDISVQVVEEAKRAK